MNQQIDLDLIRRIRSGDLRAKEELVQKYIPMVRYIVRNQNTPPTDYEDFCQEGSIGLIKAIDEYDWENYDIKFSTFAYICILRRVFNMSKNQYKKNKIPTIVLSLNATYGDEDSRTLMDSFSDIGSEPFSEIEETWAMQKINTVLSVYLSPIEYQVIWMILSGYNLIEIQALLSLPVKVIDNARTRAKVKIKRLFLKYGSLLNPQVPMKPRKRKDLQLEVG